MIWNQLMDSIRKWLNRPKKDDQSLLAQFFFSDENLIVLAGELDSFDGRQEPERCTNLVQRLRQCQDRVLNIVNAIMDVLIKDERADRDFRVKFPEDILEDNLSGQLWFGAECLAAGSSILNRESESASMRPLAKALVKSLENVRNLLREVCLRSNTPNGPLKLDNNEYITEMLLESLKIFDRLFADFEFNYVSAMVHIKSTQEYELQELIGVLFSETLSRALKMNLLTQEMIDDCEPSIMFTIPRLAIVYGLLIYPDGPLCIDKPIDEMSEMFKPFRTLLQKIRELLWTLSNQELYLLEKSLCDSQTATVCGSGESSYRNVLEAVAADNEKHCNRDDSQLFQTQQQQQQQQQQLNIDCFYKEFKMCKDEVEKTTQRPLSATETITVTADDEQTPVILNISRPPATLREISQKHSTGSGHSSTKSRSHHQKSHRKHVVVATVASTSSATTTSSALLTATGFIEDRLALLKADIAFRNEIKSKFRSSEDLLHRLFVCVSGVADQLQTNFASDLRSILKSVYLINNSKNSNRNIVSESISKKDNPFDNLEYLPPASDVIISTEDFEPDSSILAQEALFVDTETYFQRLEISRTETTTLPSTVTVTANNRNENDDSGTNTTALDSSQQQQHLLPPVWIPDIDAPKCMDCDITFTVLKRRHHCRKCGKIFCAKCSSNNIPLPQFGHFKAVRVCNICFFSTSTTSSSSSSSSSASTTTQSSPS